MWETPVERVAARVILLDGAGRVLLFHGFDPGDPGAGSWWLTPGGGLEPGETPAQGAHREVFEETGFLLPDDLGPVVHERVARFRFEGVDYRQSESYFFVAVDGFTVDDAGWTEIERRGTIRHRWWPLAELRVTPDAVYPEGLADLAARLASGPAGR